MAYAKYNEDNREITEERFDNSNFYKRINCSPMVYSQGWNDTIHQPEVRADERELYGHPRLF